MRSPIDAFSVVWSPDAFPFPMQELAVHPRGPFERRILAVGDIVPAWRVDVRPASPGNTRSFPTGSQGFLEFTIHPPPTTPIAKAEAFAAGMYLETVNLGVDRDYRGTGVGSALLACFEDRGRAFGAEYLCVGRVQNQDVLEPMLRRRGYVFPTRNDFGFKRL